MLEATGQYVLFSGCAAQGAGTPARNATIALARYLHIGLLEAPHNGCCGARADRKVSNEARQQTLAPLYEAASSGLDIVCLSPACCHVIAAYAPAEGEASAHPVAARDLVGWLAEDYTLPRLTEIVTSPLGGLRVALHASCHGDHNVVQRAVPAAESAPAAPRGGLGGLLSKVRPSGGRHDGEALVTRSDRPASADTNRMLADLVTAIGADVVGEVSAPGHCPMRPLALGLRGRLLGSGSVPECLGLAVRADASVLVTPCFLCFIGLNSYQRGLRRDDTTRAIPVLHISQLVGLACGLSPQRLELGHTTASARRILLPYVA